MRRSMRGKLAALTVPLWVLVLSGNTTPQCVPIPVEPEAVCEPFVSALAECPFTLAEDHPAGGDCPLSALCMNAPCATDDDCGLASSFRGGPHCVTGNCVFCWEDAQCDDGWFCRGGRCVDLPASPPTCTAPGPCDEPGCHLVNPSEDGCPICVCERPVSLPCAEDMDCMVLSSIRALHCVYGHCAECRSDDECADGTKCLPPGVCMPMLEHPSLLYGTWLIGWPGGMDHFSYLRFEPDGTLRRGAYESDQPAWSDDIAIPICPAVGWPPTGGMLGRWAPELTASGYLVVRMSISGPCGPAEAWSARYVVELGDDGRTARFQDVDGDWEYWAGRVPTERCEGDMSRCDSPEWSDVYDWAE